MWSKLIFGSCCGCEALELMVVFTQSSPEAAGGSLLVTGDSAGSTATKAPTLLATCLRYRHRCHLSEAGTAWIACLETSGINETVLLMLLWQRSFQSVVGVGSKKDVNSCRWLSEVESENCWIKSNEAESGTYLYIKPIKQTTHARTITPRTVAAVPVGVPVEAEGEAY